MPNAPLPTVGFVGLGRMGMPMCRNLLEAGHPMVVFNRTPAKAAPLVALGATMAATIAELAGRCDIVLTCLDTVAASEAVFLGPDGVVAHAREGRTLLIDHGTISPALAERIAQAAAARGLEFLDAPVSGGPEGAERRTLAIMAGGSEGAFERALPVLQASAQTVARLGPAGAGSRAKLVNQLLTFVHGAVAAEAIALAQRSGLDLGALSEVLRASFGHSRMLERTLTRVRAGNYDAGAALSLFEKDLGLVLEAGAIVGLPLPVADGARALLDAAIRDGLGARDIAALQLRYPPA